MPDIDVIAVITAKPGSEQLVREALSALIAPTREEEGCVSYHLSVSTADPSTFVTVEKWRSPSDLDAHLQTAHVQSALSDAGPYLAVPPSIHPLDPIT